MKRATPRPRNRKVPTTVNTEETVLYEVDINLEEVEAEVALLPTEDIEVLVPPAPIQTAEEHNGPVMNRLYKAPQRFIRPFNSNSQAEQGDLRPP
jgi:hypothetical protein